MATQTNKQLFIEALTSNLIDNTNRQQILDLAGQIIPDEDTWRKVAYDNPALQKGLRAYRKSHPQYKRIDPPIEVVIEWLLRRGQILYCEKVEERLMRIHDLLMSIGLIDIDEAVPVDGMKIMTLRVLSQVDPLIDD